MGIFPSTLICLLLASLFISLKKKCRLLQDSVVSIKSIIKSPVFLYISNIKFGVKKEKTLSLDLTKALGTDSISARHFEWSLPCCRQILDSALLSQIKLKMALSCLLLPVTVTKLRNCCFSFTDPKWSLHLLLWQKTSCKTRTDLGARLSGT